MNRLQGRFYKKMEIDSLRNRHNISLGQKFGLLTVVGSQSKKGGHKWFLCDCECGGKTVANPRKLILGKTKHCGCQSKMRDGKYHISYYVWQTMRQRCENPNNQSYRDYGGRGIGVCKEWQTFEGFLNTFPPRPNKDFQIDRINVNGNYEPSNCRWVHKTTNATYNKRTTLQEYEVAEIRVFLDRNIPIKKIARFYDVRVSVIRNILNHKTYLQKVI